MFLQATTLFAFADFINLIYLDLLINLILISAASSRCPHTLQTPWHECLCTTLITYSADNIHYVNLDLDTV